jgi:hypothetical protein
MLLFVAWVSPSPTLGTITAKVKQALEIAPNPFQVSKQVSMLIILIIKKIK